MKYLGTVIILVLSFSATAWSQITIAPTNLFLDANTRFGQYVVINSGNQTQEVSVDFLFAYSATDQDGNRRTVTEDSTVSKQYSVAEYVRAFPQNFTLVPGERQMVRLRISAPNDLPDGTYWSRIRTSSTPETPPVEIQSTDAVSAVVGVTLTQTTGLFYKVGDVNTEVTVDDLRMEFNEDETMSVLVDYTRSGNSPFLGSITLNLTDESGQEVRRSLISTSIYFDGTYKQVFDTADLEPGNYTANVFIESSRPDVAANSLIQMEPATYSENFVLQ